MVAIPPFNDLIGSPLESWFQSFIKEKLSFNDYYSTVGQIELNQFDVNVPKGQHLEIDGILLINKTCVIFEYTAEGGHFRDKIKKFLRNAQIFTSGGTLSQRERFKLIGIPDDRLDDFEEVTNWKLAFFCTHPEFENREFRNNEFLEFSVAEKLKIFKPEQLEYLRQLSNLIGVFGRNELLSALDFSPRDLGDMDENLTIDYIKAEGKHITESGNVKADLYLVKLNVMQLLNMARVSRYEGIPLIFEDSNQNYQRFLKSEKLEAIANKFIGNNKRKTFPNTITIALPSDCVENGSRLVIPKKFSSLDIIDGQHRLFGYTHNQISQQVREESEILATAIKFRADSEREITQNAARVFCEINSSQARVQKDLLYLIKYEVLGDRDFPALAGKVILDCHRRRGKSLEGMFLISTLKRKNRLNMPSIEITGIIDNDLIPLMRGMDSQGNPVTVAVFETAFEVATTTHSTDPEKLCNQTVAILDRYFNYISLVFSLDWKENAETHLITPAYFSALIRLLRYLLFEKQISGNDIRRELELLKLRVDAVTKPNHSPSFYSEHQSLPHPSDGVDVVYNYLITVLQGSA